MNELQSSKTLRGRVTTVFVLSDHLREPNWGHQTSYLADMDPERFIDQSLKQKGSVCCSLQGGYGILVGGTPWNGDNDEDYEGEGDHLHIYFDDLIMTLGFPIAVTELLKGKKKSGFFHYDECDGRMEMVGNREVRVWDERGGGDDMVLDLVEFGEALLVRGREFEVFWQKMLEILHKRTEKETNNHQNRELNKRIEHVQSWEVSKLMDGLERALHNLVFRENGEIIWADFRLALRGNLPEVTEAIGPPGGFDYFRLEWKSLEEGCLMRIRDFSYAHAENGFSWYHNLVKREKRHWVERWGLEENPPWLVLRAKRKGPAKPEMVTFMGLYLCLPWDWEKIGRIRSLDQAHLEDIEARDWLEQLRGQDGPLRGNFAIQFHEKLMNGDWVELKAEDEWFERVQDMTTLEEAMALPRAVVALLNGAEKASWGPHTLSWDERPGHFLFSMDGKKPMAPVDDLMYSLLKIELGNLLSRGQQLLELAENDPDREQLLEKISAIPLDELADLVKTFRKAYQASLAQHKKKGKNKRK